MQEIFIYSSSDKQPVQKYDLLVCPGRQGPKKETSQKRVKRYGSIVELVHFGKKLPHDLFPPSRNWSKRLKVQFVDWT